MDTRIENTCRLCLNEYDDIQKLCEISDYLQVIQNVAQIEVNLSFLLTISALKKCFFITDLPKYHGSVKDLYELRVSCTTREHGSTQYCRFRTKMDGFSN